MGVTVHPRSDLKNMYLMYSKNPIQFFEFAIDHFFLLWGGGHPLRIAHFPFFGATRGSKNPKLILELGITVFYITNVGIFEIFNFLLFLGFRRSYFS